MKKALLIMPLMAVAFSMSGCSLLRNLINGGGKNSGSNSQQGSGSQQSSGSQSSQQGGGTTYKLDLAATGLSDDSTSSETFTVGDVDFVFPDGILVNTTYNEFGLKTEKNVTMKTNKSNLKIKKVVFDNYHYNGSPLYAGESASGTPISASSQADGSASNEIIVTWENLDNAAYTYHNVWTSNAWTFSISVTVA